MQIHVVCLQLAGDQAEVSHIVYLEGCLQDNIWEDPEEHISAGFLLCVCVSLALESQKPDTELYARPHHWWAEGK